jgi:hypothetical protein
MLRIIFSLVVSLLIAIGGSGCARTVVIAETLQLALDHKVYLKHNIWYKEKTRKKLSCLNLQEGKILPFGTEIEPIEATDNELSFKTMDGKKFRIKYDHSLIMLPMEAYIKQIFTTKSRAELTKGMKASRVKLLLAGKIKQGMTKEQVILACGNPPACRTPSQVNSTWIYWLNLESVYRVIFRQDKVNVIVNIDDKFN